jgi:hypothetical protein
MSVIECSTAAATCARPDSTYSPHDLFHLVRGARGGSARSDRIPAHVAMPSARPWADGSICRADFANAYILCKTRGPCADHTIMIGLHILSGLAPPHRRPRPAPLVSSMFSRAAQREMSCLVRS